MVEAAGTLRVGLDAHVVGRRRTGNERYVVELGSALARRADVEVLAYVDRGTAWPSPPPVPVLGELRFRQPQIRIPLELPVRTRRDRVDLLHVQFVAPPICGVPVVTMVQDVSFEDRPDLFARHTRLRLQAMVRLAVRRSAVILVPSAFTRDRVIAHYGIEPTRVFVTPLGVSPRRGGFRNTPAGALRLALGLPERFVLTVSEIHPRKNIPRLVAAVGRARELVGEDLGLVIAGAPGWRADEVDQAVAAAHGEAWVHRLGYVTDEMLGDLYGAARVVAYPSLYEGFGLPVLEALSAGTVVVASRGTSIPEVGGDACLLVDPTDMDALAEAIARAATDDALRTRLAAAGPARAALFTWDACAAATVAAYRSALDLAS